MNKEQIQNLAKEFCEAEGMSPKAMVTVDSLTETVYFEDVFSKFLQYAIDQGHVVDAEKKDLALNCLDCNSSFKYSELTTFKKRQRCPVCGSIHYEIIKPQPGESTVSSSGKEVKTAEEILSAFDVTTDPYGEDSYHKEEVLCAMDRFHRQFKSSPASTVMLPPGSAPIYTHSHEYMQIYKAWYSEQLKSKHSSGIQKDQAFLNFITTTGLSAADQSIIKGVYFKYIEQCQ